ncbi:MAG: Asp-tRNA(Asn)/Glu-tRNA(Gln) amidotransferase subunit GatC [Holosporaceae bacterium]|jgi:aspartyl-tRNA(Asn)/glutamyl-tRNA(Gln) amidotransferase subunit C|nr:Asp-tRNA(Asn)/Glu-tRNA(Gln) amidotransferase subunit GatC [Holosporaceae bacterium]
MSITKEDVGKISRLACIKIPDAEFENVCDGLNNVLNFVEQLEQVDCSSVDDSGECVVGMRERSDVAIPCDPAVMDNAPQKECNMFVVPKVIS